MTTVTDPSKLTISQIVSSLTTMQLVAIAGALASTMAAAITTTYVVATNIKEGQMNAQLAEVRGALGVSQAKLEAVQAKLDIATSRTELLLADGARMKDLAAKTKDELQAKELETKQLATKASKATNCEFIRHQLQVTQDDIGSGASMVVFSADQRGSSEPTPRQVLLQERFKLYQAQLAACS